MAEITSGTIPLHCTVCPKKPTFSDVSHLLTHIASKGHLSHYYKLKIKSASDDDSHTTIEHYDQWYADWQVEHLMSERMLQKDRKRPRRRESAPVTKKAPSKPKRRRTVGDFSPIKIEQQPIAESIEQQPTAEPSYPFLPNPFVFAPMQQKPKRPRLYLWDTKRPCSIDPVPIEPSPSSSPLRLLFPPSAPFAPMVPSQPALQDEEDETLTEVTRLKGIYWPGMNIFDAATPITKRRRNQKKETSVAVSLERNALLVEPNEVIFTPYGTMKKSRYIDGRINNDSSPYKLDIPTPQPKRRQARKPLADKDKNVPNSQNRQQSVPSLRGLSPSKSIASSTVSFALPAPGKKRKRGFKVLDERDEIERPAKHRAAPLVPQPTEERAFGNPTGMHLLNSAFHHSPPFNVDSAQTGPPMMDLVNAQPHNAFFADAFGHYQPAFFGVPYYGYGYGYYGPPQYNRPGFIPLAAQQPALPQQEPARNASPSNRVHDADEDNQVVEETDERPSLPTRDGENTRESTETIEMELCARLGSRRHNHDHIDDGQTISAANSESI